MTINNIIKSLIETTAKTIIITLSAMMTFIMVLALLTPAETPCGEYIKPLPYWFDSEYVADGLTCMN